MENVSLFSGPNIEAMEHNFPQMLLYKPFYYHISGVGVLWAISPQVLHWLSFLTLI